MTDSEPAAQLIELLEATGDYRVLRRLQPRATFRERNDTPVKIGMILDVETTGLDTVKDEVIELGMVAFEFDAAGQVYGVTDTFSALRDPGVPISAEITRITGIDDAMVSGAVLEPLLIAEFADAASAVISHKAGFDRRFAERLWPGFAKKAWACSMNEIDWRAEGFQSTSLYALLTGCGLFHEGHKAIEDCRALLEVLAQPLPSGETALKRLLDTARQPTIRVWAPDTPYGINDKLKARGYRWNDGSKSTVPKSWWRNVPESAVPDEISFLHSEIYGRPFDVPTSKITAWDRHSVRCD